MGLIKSTKRRPRGGGITLSQVAQRAGVHPGTVSRALQGDERVAPATLEHIQRIAKELNYVPNIAARTLARGKTQTIAITTGSLHEHYYAQIIHCLEKELKASNYNRLILSGQEGDLHSAMNASSVDGVIAIDRCPKAEELRYSQDSPPIPCVYGGVVNNQWTDVSTIDLIEIDLSPAVREALEMMLASGCQRVAYLVTAEKMLSPDEVRAQAYIATLRDGCKECEFINVGIGDAELVHEIVRDKLAQYIEQHGCPDGLLCQNDEVTIVAQSVIKEKGLRIPDDVQIVGCDGLDYLEYLTPAVSTVVQPVQQMCALAWQFLQNRLENPSLPRQHQILKAQLRIRPSLKQTPNS